MSSGRLSEMQGGGAEFVGCSSNTSSYPHSAPTIGLFKCKRVYMLQNFPLLLLLLCCTRGRAPAMRGICQAAAVVTNKFVLIYGNVLGIVVNHSGYLHQPVKRHTVTRRGRSSRSSKPSPASRPRLLLLLRSNLLVPADEHHMYSS